MTEKSKTAEFIGNREYYWIDKKMIENGIEDIFDRRIVTFFKALS